MAGQDHDALTVVLVLVAAVTLAVGGWHHEHHCWPTLRARIREIGIRKAAGSHPIARSSCSFLPRRSFISLTGGIAGTLVGLSIPLSIRFFTDVAIPISPWSVVIGLTSATVVASSSAPSQPPAPRKWTPSRR